VRDNKTKETSPGRLAIALGFLYTFGKRNITMAKESRARRREVILYLERAREALEVAAHNLDSGFFAASVNRSYYAVFYAANAMLSTQGLARSKHSGVIAAFRERFIKTGLIDVEYSHTYGRLMDDRHLGDYEIWASIAAGDAACDLADARLFVDRIEVYLEDKGWL
jgi:uncharacterized protein (UPF0332 family)